MIIENKFHKKTNTIYIHDGKFHADDVLFAAMACIVSEKNENEVTIKRIDQVDNELNNKNAIVGDVGYGIYDHHVKVNGEQSLGLKTNMGTDASACLLLYRDISQYLFPGKRSETKSLFEAFLNIIGHCDNTDDRDTFSDSINCFSPFEQNDLDQRALIAIEYAKDVVKGFVLAHTRENEGQTFCVPKICPNVFPGNNTGKYFSKKIKEHYGYVSFENKKDICLSALDTYSLACGALSYKRRKYWRNVMTKYDAEYQTEMNRRVKEELPKAVSEMHNFTIELPYYIPFNQLVKDVLAVFVLMPSLRQGYNLHILKTPNDKYRVNPTQLTKCDGCIYVPKDEHFVSFDTREHALEAVKTVAITLNALYEKGGFRIFRTIYGGLRTEFDEKEEDFATRLLCEDISLNLYARHIIEDPKNLSFVEYRKMQIAVLNNKYLIHSFCNHISFNNGTIEWNFNKPLNTQELTENDLLSTTDNDRKWDATLENFLRTEEGNDIVKQVWP